MGDFFSLVLLKLHYQVKLILPYIQKLELIHFQQEFVKKCVMQALI